MISELNGVSPFDTPGLYWREGRFSISQATSMTTSADPLGRVEIALPDDLMTAVPKRRSEFLAGRVCAALALRAAGQPMHVSRTGRAPIWPPGVTGSISHSDTRAIAVVSLTHTAIGVDCETIMQDALAQRLQPSLISPAEAQLCPPTLPFASFLTVVFSAKEALYKALSPQLDTIPGFLDVSLIALTAKHLHMVFNSRSCRVDYRLNQNECVTMLAV